MSGHSGHWSGRCGGLVACSGDRSVIPSSVGDARACYRRKVPNFECPPRPNYWSDFAQIWRIGRSLPSGSLHGVLKGGGHHGYRVGWAALGHHSHRSARARDSPCVLGSNPLLVIRSGFVSLDRELALCPRGYPFRHFPVLYGYSAISGSFSPRLRGCFAFGAHDLSNKDGSHFKCFATTGAFPGGFPPVV